LIGHRAVLLNLTAKIKPQRSSNPSERQSRQRKNSLARRVRVNFASMRLRPVACNKPARVENWLMPAYLKTLGRKPLNTWSLLVAGALFCLLTNAIPGQTSSFKIESVEGAQKPDRDDVDVSEFVVSTKDPHLKELLSEHPSTTRVSFVISPDKKWIFEHASYGSRMAGGQLFKRGNGLKFDALPGDFDESVWRFFAREEKIPEEKVPFFAGDSHEGIIDFVAWSSDSARVLVSLRAGDFDGNRQRGVYLWYAYFNTKEGKFELTDRLRSANEGAWERWENFGEERAGKFKELTTAERVDQSARSKSEKK